MTDFNLIGRIANLSYSKTEWEVLNPTLNKGEIGYEIDTGEIKIGDGSTSWTELSYASKKFIESYVESSLSSTSVNPVQNKVVDSAITTLTNSLNTESTERKANISTLTENIAAIDTKLDTEISDRESADSDIRTVLSNEVSDRTSAMSTLTSSLNTTKTDLITEINSRKSADSEIKVSLNTEISERKASDETLTDLIDEVSTKLDTESTDRVNSDDEIKALVSTEVSDRKNAISTVEEAILDVKNTYVKKVTGKGLSTNDYTAEDKVKVASVESGAQVNVIESITTNGTKLVPVGKTVDISIPARISDLTNDSNYAVKATTLAGYGISDTYTKTEIDGKLSSAMNYKGQVATVDKLPTDSNHKGDVWDVAENGHNYAWNGTTWDDLGGMVDLSGYYTKDTTDSLLASKVDKVEGKQLSTNDYTSVERTKLAGIEEGATKTVVDVVLTDTSTNPVQGKVVKAAIDSKAEKSAVDTSLDNLEASINEERTAREAADIDINTKIGNIESNYVKKDGAKVLSTNDYTSAEKAKLEGIETGATKIIVDSVLSDSSLNPVQNIIVKAAIDKLTTDLNTETTTRSNANASLEAKITALNSDKVDKESGKGLSSNDYTTMEKTKLSGIETGATKTVIDSSFDDSSTNPVQNKVVKSAIDTINSSLDSYVKKDGTKVLSTNDYTTADKTKLASIESGATKTTVDSTISSVSTNPVQSKVIFTALDLKANTSDVESTYVKKVTGKDLSTNDFTTELKDKLVNLDPDASKVTVDDVLSTSSTNPVQNKVISTAINTLNASTTSLNSRMTKAEKRLNKLESTLYGFHIDSSESDPSACITYLENAVGKTPAYMNFSAGTFNYGSWSKDDFFMPRPCMLKYDGTVDYYLDPDDYTKKEDGTASDVANTDYEGNAMMEWGRDGNQIWYKIVPGTTNTADADIYIASNQIDEDYHCWSFIDSEGNIKDHFYTSIYNGSKITGSDSVVRLRSLSGQMPCHNTTPANEATYAMANATDSSKVSWYIATYADMILISFLLTLIGKSLDTQTVFGYGCANDYDSTDPTGSEYYGIHASGETNDKGLFWGSNVITKGSCKPVKVFGMENYWGNIWQRIAGLVNDHGVEKVKLTWGTEDGSTGTGYQLGSSSVTGFLTVCNAPTSGGYVKYWYYTPYGAAVQYNTSGGSASTYYCDYSWWANTNLYVAVFGGDVSFGSDCGSWCVLLADSWSYSYWDIGASPSLR